MPIQFERSRLGRRWWQHAVRLAAAAVLAMLLAAAALPWWLPRAWLAGHIQQDLSDQLGAAVTLEELSVSWGQGIVIRGLKVANPPGFGAEPLLAAPVVRLPFRPLALLTDGRVGWMTVERPELRVVAAGDGRVNLLQLRPPHQRVEARRTRILGGTATFVAPDGRQVRLILSDAQIHARRLNPLGRITLTGRLEQPGAAAPVFADVTIDEGRAQVELGFSDLDLAVLQTGGLLELPLARLGGRARGRLRLPIRQGAVRSGRLDVAVAGLDVEPLSGSSWPVLPWAQLSVEGDLDLAGGLAEVSRLRLTAEATELDCRGQFNASLVEGSWLGVHNLRLEGWVDPQALSALLGWPGKEARGPVLTGPVAVALTYDRIEQDILARLTLDATQAMLAVDGRVIKPAGTTLQCLLQASCKPKTWQFSFDHTELRLGGNQFVGRGALDNIRRLARNWLAPEHAWTLEEVWGEVAGLDWAGQWQITELESLRALHPAVAAALSGVELEGEITGLWELSHDGDSRFQARLACGPSSRLRLAGLFHKPPDVSVELYVGGLLNDEQPRLREGRLELACGRGRLELRLTDLGYGPAAGAERGWAAGTFSADGLEEIARCMGPAGEAARDAAAPPALSGALSGQFRVESGDRTLRLHVQSDATQLAVCPRGRPVKRAGEPVTASLDWLTERDTGRTVARAALHHDAADAQAVLQYGASPWSLDLETSIHDAGWLQRRLAPAADDALRLEGQAAVSVRLEGRPEGLLARLGVDARNLGASKEGCGLLKRRGDALRLTATGRVAGGWGGPGGAAPAETVALGAWAVLSSSAVSLDELSLNLEEAALRWRGEPAALSGTIRARDLVLAWSDGRGRLEGLRDVRSDGLRLRAADQEAMLVLDVREPLSGPTGQVALLADRIDAARLDGWCGGAAADRPELDEPYRQDLARRAGELLERAAAAAARAELTFTADVGLLQNWLDPNTGRRCDVRELSLRGSVAGGQVDLQYAAGVNGGTQVERFRTDLSGRRPQLAVEARTLDMLATEPLQAQVAMSFPDNELRGTLWRESALSAPLAEAVVGFLEPRLPVHLAGSARAHMRRGVTRGRAAPLFVTQVFPGLNLVEYEYREMVAFSEFEPDGTVRNDMVFSGRVYDLYIEGSTDADQIGRYEVGIILLGSQQSPEWNHRYRQGRIPLLRFKARLAGGRKVDEEVSFLWPNQSAFTIFLKNNYFYRLWRQQ